MSFKVPVSQVENLRVMLRRIVGVARLNGSVFRSLKEDHAATSQSLLILGTVGLSFGLGFATSLGTDLREILLGAVVGGAVAFVLGFVWLSLSYLVGTRLFRGTTTYWGLARPLFFSSSPGLIFLLTIIPVRPIQDVARSVGVAWIAIASVSAVKNALGFDSQRGFMTFIIVAFIILITYGLFSSI